VKNDDDDDDDTFINIHRLVYTHTCIHAVLTEAYKHVFSVLSYKRGKYSFLLLLLLLPPAKEISSTLKNIQPNVTHLIEMSRISASDIFGKTAKYDQKSFFAHFHILLKMGT